jgi:hypothetical protein
MCLQEFKKGFTSWVEDLETLYFNLPKHSTLKEGIIYGKKEEKSSNEEKSCEKEDGKA